MPGSNLIKLFDELKRRHVFRVAGAYLVSGWLLLEVASLLLDTFSSPDWLMKAVVVLVGLGFPLALLLAWAFQITPEGTRLESELARERSDSARHSKTNVAPVEKQEASIAVLPLNLIGNSGEDDYIAEGMTEDLITLLSRSPGLVVIARNTSNLYRGGDIAVRKIGEELGIRYVVEGSVRRVGENLRVNIQLIEAASEKNLWAKRFDFAESELFNVQEDICQRISTQLVDWVGDAEAHRAERMPADQIDSWLLTQRAIHTYFSGPDQSTTAAACEFIEQAVDLDPQYPYALAFAAHLYTIAIVLGFVNDPEAHRALAYEYIERALKIAPKDPMVQWCWGVVQGFMGDKVSAVNALERAMEGNPNDPHVLADLGFFMGEIGRIEEGTELIQRAFRLSPHEPRAYIWRFYLGVLVSRTDPEKALVEYDRSIGLFNKYVPALVARIVVLGMLGRDEEATAAAAELVARRPDVTLARIHKMYEMSVGDPARREQYLAIIDRFAKGHIS